MNQPCFSGGSNLTWKMFGARLWTALFQASGAIGASVDQLTGGMVEEVEQECFRTAVPDLGVDETQV
jgi:hypothetical protein